MVSGARGEKMVLVLRYIFLVALGVASIIAFISATAGTGQMLLASTGHRIDNPDALGFWILFAMAAFSLLSMFRFVWLGIPAMVRGWFSDHKDKFVTLLLGGIVCIIFLVT